MREVVAQVNTNLPLFDVKTESEQIDRLLFQERLVARLSSFFGLLALVPACVGLYGLLSYEVSRCTREIGIRITLGAHQGSVLKLVLRQGMVLTIVGAAVGIGVALGVTRYLTSGVLRCARPRPADDDRGFCAACTCRACRVLRSGTACHAGRSDSRSAARIECSPAGPPLKHAAA
jgi:ABC-type antimicrobial peptide transport system permease subunit